MVVGLKRTLSEGSGVSRKIVGSKWEVGGFWAIPFWWWPSFLWSVRGWKHAQSGGAKPQEWGRTSRCGPGAWSTGAGTIDLGMTGSQTGFHLPSDAIANERTFERHRWELEVRIRALSDCQLANCASVFLFGRCKRHFEPS